jgi:hypothetical protein
MKTNTRAVWTPNGRTQVAKRKKEAFLNNMTEAAVAGLNAPPGEVWLDDYLTRPQLKFFGREAASAGMTCGELLNHIIETGLKSRLKKREVTA